MAKTLDYIARQITNLNNTINGNELLENEGMMITAKHIASNPDFIYGNSVEFIKMGKFSRDSRVEATYGVNVIFWKELKKTADNKGKDKAEYFKEKILTFKGSQDKDVRTYFERLYRKPSSLYNLLVEALANYINYQVMNITFQTQSITMFDKIYTNLNYSSLPNGIINTIQTTDYNFLKDYATIDTTNMEIMMKNLCPKNLNLEEFSLEQTSKFFSSVANSELNSIKIDKSYFNGSNRLVNINRSATRFNFSPVSNESKCSAEDLSKISNKAEFVKNLPNNIEFIRVNGIKGKDILKNIEPFNILSRNFYDTYFSDQPALTQSKNGYKAISIKLYFDKINEVFMNVRSNDMYFALTCATYNDSIND